MQNPKGSSRGFAALAMVLLLILIPLVLLIFTALPTSINPGFRNVLLVAVVGLSGLIGVSALKR
jgi:uncharacterized membrane-anchored protein